MPSLLSNAIISIQLAVEDYENEDPNRVLSAVRNMSAGILLLFKEKLRRLSPDDSCDILVRSNIELTMKSDGSIGVVAKKSNKTVDTQQIEERFKAFGVSADWARFKKMNEIRNHIEHYYTDTPPAQLKIMLADAFAVIEDFVSRELGVAARDLLGAYVWSVFMTQAALYEKERAYCAEALSLIDWPTSAHEAVAEFLKCECGSPLIRPVAHNNQYEVIQFEFECSQCGSRNAYGEIAIEAVSACFEMENQRCIKDGGNPIIETCYACRRPTVVTTDGNHCLACGEPNTIEYCDICGNEIDPMSIPRNSMCSYCNHVSSKGD